MNELLTQALSIGRGMWKHRWAGIVVAWIVAAVGAVVVFRLPDQYEASARIYVDTQSILKPLMSGLAVQPNIEQQVALLSRTLISRPNIEKLVRMADLDLGVKPGNEQTSLVDDLMGRVRIDRTGRDNMYNLAFRDQDPEKAKRLIQSLVSVFIESGLGASRRGTDSAKAFLDQQIRSYEQQMEEALARINAFKLRNIDQQSNDGRDVASRIVEFRDALSRTQLELREAENAREAMRTQLEQQQKIDREGLQNMVQDQAPLEIATPELDSRINGHKRNLDALLTRFTERHPDVVMTRRLIKDLEEQKKAEIEQKRKVARAAAQSASGAVGASPIAQELMRAVASADIQVATLRARVGEFAARLERAQEAAKRAPGIEAEGAQLNRDYSTLKSSYDSLVKRRETAEWSGRLEEASGLVDFQLIEPPRVTPKPVAPNRLAMLPIALVASLGAGLFVAFALSQIRLVVFSAGDLRHKTGLPVLGVVSYVIGPAEVRRQRLGNAYFALASGSLVGIFVAGFIAMTMMAS